MLSLTLPSPADVARSLNLQDALPLSYPMAACTRGQKDYPGYDRDEARVRLGDGQPAFEAACAALRAWQMFPAGWTRILPADTPIVEGRNLRMNARFLGLWWLNACRIVYVSEGPGHLGFAYGTLKGAHMESGEELFLIEMDAEGAVWYQIRAVSRPQRLVARLAYPLMRLLQARFRKDSTRQMQAYVEAQILHTKSYV
jgi:uncharacterized protein (UPF0548 family)